MSVGLRLAGFGALLAVVGVASYALGDAVGPVGPVAAEEHSSAATAADEGDHGGGHAGEAADPDGITGLAVSDGAFTLRPATTDLRLGEQSFRFTIERSDGSALTDYDATHERELHLVVVRRDLTRFQHVHPTRDAAGTWSLPLRLDGAGPYRVYADFAPAGEPARALGVDVTVPGSYVPEPRGAGQQLVSEGGGYAVTASGRLRAGVESTLAFDVRREGVAVTDLQPYLGARGHLVVLREGDLAYLHVHPDDDDLSFATTVPSAGSYAGFLDTRHRDVVRTAVFRLEATR